MQEYDPNVKYASKLPSQYSTLYGFSAMYVIMDVFSIMFQNTQNVPLAQYILKLEISRIARIKWTKALVSVNDFFTYNYQSTLLFTMYLVCLDLCIGDMALALELPCCSRHAFSIKYSGSEYSSTGLQVTIISTCSYSGCGQISYFSGNFVYCVSF
jgi:hypothetical protein